MKNNWILILIALCLFYLSCQQSNSKELRWLTNFEQSIKESKARNVPIMMRFQGSDWCGNCWRLDSTLFETEAFKEFAPKKFVLLALDFPNKPENKLPEDQTIHNKKLLEKYNPGGGFPAVIVLNNRSEVLGKMSVAPNSANEYIAQLNKIVNESSEK